MNRTFKSAALAAVAMLGFTSSSHAQDIAVSHFKQVLIPNGAIAQREYLNVFAPTEVGEESSEIYYIHNTHDSGILSLVGDIIISGPDAGEFYMNQPLEPVLAPGENMGIVVRFKPTSAGVKNAMLTITSNDPDAEGSYTFDLQGLAYTGEQPPLTYLAANYAGKLKLKADKKNPGALKVKAKAGVFNAGDAEVESISWAMYASPNAFVDISTDLVDSGTIKNLKINKSENPKYRKAKGKFTLPYQKGTLVTIFSQDPPAAESEWFFTNITSQEFGLINE